MSQAVNPSSAPETPASQSEVRRSYIAMVVRDVFKRTGAVIGGVWITILVLAAVFAPFLANSRPVLMQDAEGNWSSPLLTFLTVQDVLLLLSAAAVALIMPWRRIALRDRLLATLAVIGIIVVLGFWPGSIGPFVTDGASGWIEGMQEWRSGSAETEQASAVDESAAVNSRLVQDGEADTQPGFPFGALFWWALRWGLLLGLVGAVALVLRALFTSSQSAMAFRFGAVGVAVVIGGWLIASPVEPPRGMHAAFDQYRVGLRNETIRSAYYTPIRFSPTDYQVDHDDPQLLPPSSRHLMGTVLEGADLFSRMIYATRIALVIGLISTSIALFIGVIVGGFMGYFSGMVDMIGMRLVEIIEAIPTLFLLIIFVAFFGRDLYMIMAIIGVTSWTGYARFVRAEFLRLRKQDYVQAALACGLPLRSVLFRHMLPNGVAPVLVSASFGVASAILAEAVLSFLGLGLIDEPSWGQMLNQAVGSAGTFTWWVAIYPGVAIFLTVFAYNLIGEALRDAIDPHLKKASQL